MSRAPTVPSVMRWGCATVLLGPPTIYSLLTQIARWSSWDPASRPDLIEMVWKPYDAFYVVPLLIFSPLSLFFLVTPRNVVVWFGVSFAYLTAGAMTRMGVNLMGDLLERRRQTATATEPISPESVAPEAEGTPESTDS